jgi:hypothetical protein
MQTVSGNCMKASKLIIPFFALLLYSCSHSNDSSSSTNKASTVAKKESPKVNQNKVHFEMGKPVFKTLSKKNSNPFLSLNFNKAIAYDYEGGKGEGVIEIIDSNGVLAPTVTKSRELTIKQKNLVTHLFGSNSTYGEGYAACFEPHLGILFFYNDKVVAYLSICLECNYLSSSFLIPATSFKKIKVSDDFEYSAEGFSKIGRRKINSLCKELNFDHCVANTE